MRGHRKKCKDYLGNEYNSIREMCKVYGINENTYITRIRRGSTVEEALTGEVKKDACRNCKKCKDHLGNEYNSIVEMCMAYSIDKTTYYNRLKRGLSVEEALTIPTYVDGCPHPKDYFSLNILNFIKSKCHDDRELYELESKLGISVTKFSFTIEDGIKVANYFNVDFNKLIGCSPATYIKLRNYKKLKSEFVDILRYFQYLNADFSDDICNFIDTILPEMEKEIFGEERDSE